jgi:hypothetical protein
MAEHKRFCVEECRDGGFIVQDVSCWSDPGNMSVYVFASSTIGEALDFIRAAMTTEVKVRASDAEVEQAKWAIESAGPLVHVDDVPLWRR